MKTEINIEKIKNLTSCFLKDLNHLIDAGEKEIKKTKIDFKPKSIKDFFTKYNIFDKNENFSFKGTIQGKEFMQNELMMSDLNNLDEFKNIKHLFVIAFPKFMINYDIYTPYYHTKNHITDLQKNEDIETKAIIREDVINENYFNFKKDLFYLYSINYQKNVGNKNVITIRYADFNFDELMQKELIYSKYTYLNTILNDINFKAIYSESELKKEGKLMSHSVFCYYNKIKNREYIVLHLNDINDTQEQATLGIKIENKVLTLDQLKSFKNQIASNNIIKTVLKFCETNNIKVNLQNNDLKLK